MNLTRTMGNPRLFPAIAAVVSVGSLASAFIAQYAFGLEPCILCLYQRVPFAVAIGLGVLGAARPCLAGPIMAALAATFATGAAIAFYHNGVEQHWWAAATSCAEGGQLATSPADLLKSLQTKSPKPCDQVDWTFLGVSMASWNVLFSSGLAAASLWAWRRLKGQKP